MKKVKVTTIMTHESYRDFNRTHYRFMMRRKKWWFYLFLVLSIPLIILYFTSPIGKDYFWGTFFIVLDILIVVETCTTVLPDSFTRRFLRRNPDFLELENLYEFWDDYFSISNHQESTRISYDKLKQVIEVDEYFYLYVNTQMAYFVEKSNLTEKEIERVRTYLEKAVGKKYVKKR